MTWWAALIVGFVVGVLGTLAYVWWRVKDMWR